MSSASVGKRGSAATVRACDSCRRRKRKCLWTPGERSCNPCLQIKESCATTYVRKQRSKPQRRNQIAEYEARIKRLESLLQDRTAAQPHLEEQPLPPADESNPLELCLDSLQKEVEVFSDRESLRFSRASYEEYPNAFEEEPEPEPEPEPETEPVQSLDSVPTNSTPEDFITPSTDEFEPSAEFQADAALLQDPLFQPPLAIDDLSIAEIEPAPARPKCDGSMPPPELGTILLSEFLNDFNTVFPLYRPYAIAEHLRVCYAGLSDGTALAWASTFVVFGLAHRSRGMSLTANPQDNEMADQYIARLIPTISGVLMAPPSLHLVQCLLGLAMLIRTSSHSMPYSLFVWTALRIAQSLAYDGQTGALGQVEDVEQQRRVFWLVFIQAMDENMLSNVPVPYRREDIAAHAPEALHSYPPLDSCGIITAAEGNWKVPLFTLRVRLVLLQAEAIEKALLVKVPNTASRGVVATAHELLERLQAWRKHDLFLLSPSKLMELLYRSDLVHVLAVEASYFATVFRLQTLLVLGCDSLLNPFSVDALAKLAAQKEHAAHKDAERLLALLSVAPQGDVGIYWMVKLPIVAALTTILSYHLHNPSEVPSADAMREYSSILRTLGILVQKSNDVELQRARDLCMQLFSRIETGLRVKWLQEKVDSGELGPFTSAQTVAPK